MRVFRLQPSDYTDNLVDGEEMTKRPYPIYVTEDGWVKKYTNLRRAIGFTTDPNTYDIPVRWEEAIVDIASVVGMYLVVSDPDAHWSTLVNAIMKAEEIDARPDESQAR